MIPLVKKIALKYVSRTNASITFDDLYGEGCLGYMQAVDRFDKEIQENFDAFAQKRIEGAILDYLRKHKIVGNTKTSTVTAIPIEDYHLITEGHDVQFEYNELLSILTEALKTHPSRFVKRVAGHYFTTDDNVKKTAEACKTTPTKARTAISKMTKHLKKTLQSKNFIKT